MNFTTAVDRDMTRKACCECKHWSREYSYDCRRKAYGPQPDEWSWHYSDGWTQVPAPVIKRYDCKTDNADGYCAGFEAKPPVVKTPPAPEPHPFDTLLDKLADMVKERMSE